MSFPPIDTLVPHDGQMVLLDRVVAADQETLCAEVSIAATSVFCGDGGVGSWVGVEYMAQAIAAHAGYCASLRGEPVKVGFLLGARRYECSAPLFGIGCTLRVYVQRALQGDNGLGAFECHIDDHANGTTLAKATITVFQPDNVNEFLLRSSE